MRTVSSTALAQMFAQECAEVWCAAVMINHASLGTPYRLINDTTDATIGGHTYQWYPFRISLPEQRDDGSIPRTEMVMHNVDRLLIELIESVTDQPDGELYVVRRSTTDVVEMGPFAFKLTASDYDANWIRLTFGQESDMLQQAAFALLFTPQRAPGLFT